MRIPQQIKFALLLSSPPLVTPFVKPPPLPSTPFVKNPHPPTILQNTPRSWSDLSTTISPSSPSSPPLVTLYRDTNGWCPFCERVWLALHLKNISYKESLVNLQNKPQWYLDMVPTGLVPAVLFHDDDIFEKEKPERTLVWESRDILKALDVQFPQSERLVFDDDEEFLEIQTLTSNVTTAGVQFVYGARNASLTREDLNERRRIFESQLDELDNRLLVTSAKGPFLAGDRITAVDIELIPTMERWRYQLPLTRDFDILLNRPSIQRWFDALDDHPAYRNRVRGDEYSWTAVTSTFLRYFSSGGEEGPSEEVTMAIERADRAARELARGFINVAEAEELSSEAYREAATKLIDNHEAIIADCTRDDPKSQKELMRAPTSAVEGVDLALRAVTEALLEESMDVDVSSMKGADYDVEDVVRAMRVVAERLCVPRDMGGDAARCLRGVLTTFAERAVEGVEEVVGEEMLVE